MKRRFFFGALALPFVVAVVSGGSVYFFISVFAYYTGVHVVRGKFVNLTTAQSIIGFLSGPFSDYWWKMWSKDSHYRRLPSLHK